MTYSIVARDGETGELGVAVQSHYFQVGPVVPWALAGVGAVATQSMVNVSFGPLGLDYMGAGYSAQQALKALLAGDAQPEVRQVALVDATGNVAAHTGARCIPAAGHRTGDGLSCQANLMEKDSVWDAMYEAYVSDQGDLAERLLAALDAAEADGGDIRGRQSAALLVVPAEGEAWRTRFDVRVDDHVEPLRELRRLLTLARAYELAERADAALAADADATALAELSGSAAQSIALPAGLELESLGVAGYRMTYLGSSIYIDPYVSRVPFGAVLRGRRALADLELHERWLTAPGPVLGV